MTKDYVVAPVVISYTVLESTSLTKQHGRVQYSELQVDTTC